jgi:hypothetical protein
LSKDESDAGSRKGPARRDQRAEAAPNGRALNGRRDRKLKSPLRTADHELRRQLTSLREFS